MRVRPSSASIISAGLIAAAFGLLLLVALALFSVPDRADGGGLATASQPLRTAEQDSRNAGEVAPSSTPALRAVREGEGERDPGVDRQLVAGDRREVVTRDDFAGEPSALAEDHALLELTPLSFDLVDSDFVDFNPIEEEAEAPEQPQAGDAGSVEAEALDAGAEALPLPSAAVPGPEIDGQGGAALDVNAAVEREACGTQLCPAGWVCCNESCGTCTEPGQSCSELRCSMPAFPVSVMCGRNTCSVGEVCCNFSCGICAAPGAACSQRVCD